MRTPTRLLALLLLGATVSLIDPGHAAVVRTGPPYWPDDPGWTGEPGGWADIQWDLAGPNGVDAPGAWGNLRAAGASGGRGVTVAVLDTGVAYAGTGPSPTRPGSPDLRATQVVPGYDFVDDDADPYDENGHGTHVAATIAEQTDNGYGLTGLAYGVDLMPVRVLDSAGSGDASTIAAGVRFAVEHGAKILNLSLNFDGAVDPAGLDDLREALDQAHDRGALVVVGAGNDGADAVTFPASAPHVLAVGATTDSGCLAGYSNHGTGLDLVAPGGGRDAQVADDPSCRPGRIGSPIYQMTMGGPSGFEIEGYTGTSMAAPHVSACAALVVASGVIGDDPDPDAIAQRLERTARDLGPPGRDSAYGWGLVDAHRATSPGAAVRR